LRHPQPTNAAPCADTWRLHQSAFFAVSYGLSDEQARSAPTVSALSVGGLVKHVTGMQRSWMARVAAAPDAPPKDPRPFKEISRSSGTNT